MKCHGIPENASPGSAIVLPQWGIRCLYAPRISDELRKLLTDMMRAKIPLQIIYDIHCERQIDNLGRLIDQKHPTFVSLTVIGGKDERLTKHVLYNLSAKVKREKVRLHKNDAISIHMWIKLNLERVLLYREHQVGPPSQDFILALQSPWQLAQMIQLSHGKVLAMDSTFATNKYGVRFLSALLPSCPCFFTSFPDGLMRCKQHLIVFFIVLFML